MPLTLLHMQRHQLACLPTSLDIVDPTDKMPHLLQIFRAHNPKIDTTSVDNNNLCTGTPKQNGSWWTLCPLIADQEIHLHNGTITLSSSLSTTCPIFRYPTPFE
ncbi:Ribonuclease [Trichinella spiralis]|uniref:Ribonuclease n=1 Tax=Trichinella spiralis TaxID=6334 RepID=A0ABR3KNI3_TRISP